MNDKNIDCNKETDEAPATPLEWLPGVSDENGPLVMSAWLQNNILFNVQRGYRAETPWICSMSHRGAYVLKDIDPGDTSNENWNKAVKAAVEHFSDQIRDSMQAMQSELDALKALLADASAMLSKTPEDEKGD